MSSVNKVILVGNLGADPDVNTTKAGKTVANFNVATQGFKDEDTTWHRIVVWDKLAENCVKYLTKGRQVYVEGRLQTRSYEKDGVKQYTTEVVANDVKFLGAPSGSEAEKSVF